MFTNNNPKFYFRRKHLRNGMTPEEWMLWAHIRRSQLGVKFRRQFGVGSYILDFYCFEKKVAIELDGAQHLEQKEYDKKRTAYLSSQGIKVVRFWNEDVRKNLESVLLKINSVIENTPQSRSTSTAPLEGQQG